MLTTTGRIVGQFNFWETKPPGTLTGPSEARKGAQWVATVYVRFELAVGSLVGEHVHGAPCLGGCGLAAPTGAELGRQGDSPRLVPRNAVVPPANPTKWVQIRRERCIVAACGVPRKQMSGGGGRPLQVTWRRTRPARRATGWGAAART